MARRTEPQVPARTEASSEVSSDGVARRAYELYEARGGEHGADLDDWLRAERELGDEPAKGTGDEAA